MHAFIKNAGLNKLDFAKASESGFFISQFIITCIGRRDFFSLQRTIKYISACEFYLNNPVRHLPSDDMTLDINKYNLSSMIFYSWEIKR